MRAGPYGGTILHTSTDIISVVVLPDFVHQSGRFVIVVL